MFFTMVKFAVVLTLFCICIIVVADNDSNGEVPCPVSVVEDLKIINIKLRALNTHHELDVTALKKDMQGLKKEFVDIVTGRTEESLQNDVLSTNNEVNDLNSDKITRELSSFEWTHRAIDDIHGDMALIEGKISDVKSELTIIKEEKNNSDSFEDEVKEQIKQLLANSDSSEKRLNFLESENQQLRSRIQDFENERLYPMKKEKHFQDAFQSNSKVKYRHNRQLQLEVHEMKQRFMKILEDNKNYYNQIGILTSNLNSFKSIEKKVIALEMKYKSNKKSINTEIDKLHSSMLELLESVEAQESRIDKLIPEFQNEFNKLDVEVAQLNSHHNYVKSNQNSIRESVKAIAVSVSNVMQKIDEDRSVIDKMNKSTLHLENQSKLHFYRLSDHISKTEEQQAQNSFSIDEGDFMPQIMDKMKEVEQEYEEILNHLPDTCDAINNKTGVHQIKPQGGRAIQTFCSDGWTLMQTRFNGSVEFNRNFKEYSQGFGDPNGEFWIGNEALHHITKNNCTMLKIEMIDIYDNLWIANYENIRVAPEKSGYRLSVNGFTGNASDALEYQNNMEFSTIDRDHDISNTNCAANYEGGWWFSHCQHANLNGKYTLGLIWFNSQNNQWIAVKSSRMTIKNNPTCLKA